MHWSNKLVPFRTFEGENGGGSGGGTAAGAGQQTDPKTGAAGSGNPEPKPDGGAAANTDPPKPELKFSQADVDKMIAERLDRTKKSAEADRLKAQGEFQKLSETQATELETLRKQNEETEAGYKALQIKLNADLDKQIATWPKEFQELIPKDSDYETRKGLFDKVSPAVIKVTGGTPSKAIVNGENGGTSSGGGGKAANMVDNYITGNYGHVPKNHGAQPAAK